MLKKLIPLNKRFYLSKTASKLFSAQEPKTAKTVGNSNITNFESINKIVSESLKKEIENFYPVDENQLKSILNSKGFSFVNLENSKVIKLEKKVEDKLIRIIVPPKQPDFAQSEAENEDSVITSFFITVGIENGKSGLFIDAVAFDNKIHITHIKYSNEIEALENKTFNFKKVEDNINSSLKEEYSGPHFYTLDKQLQKSFTDLLGNLGLDDQIASVLSVLAVEKDQELYLNWLKNLNTLI